ncbi:hypothetical protein MNBD_GAMMA01-621 [hydrothermal vent metagenome]|uniref:Uncharacterized protein n=1 Tax=hydrothermal vent metagenome TaxID=652676 RepID=A0A3B0VUM3_9ZZZZ
MLKIKIHEYASFEFEEAIQWYEFQADGLGKRFKQTVIKQFNAVKENPSWYPQESKGIYKAYIPTFPYKVLFTFNAIHITIWAVCHLHRKPRYWESRIR